MDREQILDAVRELASNSFYERPYGRLYKKLTDGSEHSEELLQAMEEQSFSDTFDLIWYAGCHCQREMFSDE